MTEIFSAGDRVQLTGPKGILNTITLEAGARFGSHKGEILHDDIIGKPSGSVIANHNGDQYLALKPLLSDYVLSMPRGAAIVYPKDAGQIIVEGDIFPGATVIEAGVGSGALSFPRIRPNQLGSSRRRSSAKGRRASACWHSRPGGSRHACSMGVHFRGCNSDATRWPDHCLCGNGHTAEPNGGRD